MAFFEVIILFIFLVHGVSSSLECINIVFMGNGKLSAQVQRGDCDECIKYFVATLAVHSSTKKLYREDLASNLKFGPLTFGQRNNPSCSAPHRNSLLENFKISPIKSGKESEVRVFVTEKHLVT